MTEPVSTGTPDRAAAPRRFAIAGGLLVLAVPMGIGVLAARGSGLPLLGQSPRRLTDVLSHTIETKGADAAVAQYRTLREQGFPGVRESNAATNSLGYAFLRKGDKASAIQVFQLNVETHPESANAYDSLGEAYLAAGNTALAIANYQKAVAIAPNMKSAASALQTLTNRKREPYRPLVLFHILAGVTALVSGAVAMSFRKGSRRHGLAGNVFVLCMLSMSSTGAYMAFAAPDGDVVNVLMGILTFYLVATAWSTARRRNGGTGLFDWVALLVASAVAAGLTKYGLEAARDGRSSGVFFVFGAVAVLAAVLDIRMIARGGVVGAQRVARHLWRMCSALFIAVGSLFLGQPQVFPTALRNSGVLAVPSILVVVLLVFWLIRVLFTNAYRRTASPRPKMVVREAAT